MSRTGHRGYRRNRARVLRNSDCCHWCGQLLDPDLPFPHPLSSTADHLLPIKDGGSNTGVVVAAHLKCNQARNRKQQPGAERHARDW